MKETSFDPISLEINWKRLISMVDEASAAFVRTSFSLLVREANDFAVILTDAQGRSITQSSASIPSFIGTLPATVKHFIAKFPRDTLKPGDVMITNDPWMSAGHFFDITILSPIFRGERLIGYSGSTIHHTDIGGYGIGLRMMNAERATLEETVRFVVEYALD